MRANFTCLAFMSLAVSASCGGGDDPPDYPIGAIAAAVTHYDYQLNLESRAASVDVSLTATTAGNCVRLPIRATELDLSNVTLTAAATDLPTTAQIVDGQLEACGQGWESGTTLTLHASMTVALETLEQSQVGYSLAQDNRSNDFWFLISWVGGCDRFGPCDNTPSAFATYRFTVEHPAGVQVRCPGTISEPTTTSTVCDFTYSGGPTYSTFGLVASTGWTTTSLGDWDGVATSLYDTGSTVPSRIDNTFHAGFVEMMQDTFGPFPYGDELRILTAPTYWAGFEHPGNIVLADTLGGNNVTGSYPTAHTLNHEIAHQWAGDQTTIASTYDFVWKEAMAEYLSFVYEDVALPAYGLRTAKSWKSGSLGAAYFSVPGEEPALFDYYGDVYGPGPMVLFRQLEVMYSRAAVVDAIAMVLGTESTLSVDQLQAALEASLGVSLDEYFAGWVRGTGAPVWPRVTFSYDAVASTLTVEHVNQSISTGACKFHIALDGADAGQRQLVEVDLRVGATQVIEVPTPIFSVTSTVLDPSAECLVYASTANLIDNTVKHPWLAPAQ